MKAKYLQSCCYFDTNILIYMFDNAHSAKQELSNDLFVHFHRHKLARISVQVMAEWRNASIRKFAHMIDSNFRREFLRYLTTWKPLLISPKLIVKADELCDRYNFSPYDSIHVQCALELNCEYLLTEDMHDDLVIDGKLILCNPYRELAS